MKTLWWGGLARISRDSPQDPHYRDAVDALAEHAENVAGRLAAGPTQAYGRVRDLLRSSFSNTMEAQLDKELEGIVESLVSPDGREGTSAFLGKRKPQFTGR